MKKIIFCFLILSFVAKAQNPTSFTKIKVTGMTEKLTGTRNVVQDITTKEFHFAPLSGGSGGVDITADHYKGFWNASLNTPTLTNGIGQIGDYYLVSLSGNNLSYDFRLGDKIWYDGTIWRKDNFSSNLKDVLSNGSYAEYNNGNSYYSFEPTNMYVRFADALDSDISYLVFDSNGLQLYNEKSIGINTFLSTLTLQEEPILDYRKLTSSVEVLKSVIKNNDLGVGISSNSTASNYFNYFKTDNITADRTRQLANVNGNEVISIKGNVANALGEIDLDNKYIPLSGTVSGSDLSGPIKMSRQDAYLYSDDITSSNYLVPDSGFWSLFSVEKINNYTNTFSTGDIEFSINGTNPLFKGFVGAANYSANYTPLSYVQKTYVDNLVSNSSLPTNISYTSSLRQINSSTGTGAILPIGNGTNYGLSINDFTTAEKTKLASTPTTFFNGVYSSLTGIPTTFTPSSHNHIISDVTNLQTTIDAKVANDLTASTTVAPSKTAVNTALALKYDASNPSGYQTSAQVTSGARNAISLTTTGTNGPSTYNSTTGILNVPNYASGITTELDPLALKISNNLSDLNNTSIARTNLGLGTLATQSGSFSGTSSGTNTGDNSVNTLYSSLVSNATHTGDVTGSTALTITNSVVTNSKLANMPTNTIKGVSIAGVPTDLTATQAKSILAITNSDVIGLGTLSTQNGSFLSIPQANVVNLNIDLNSKQNQLNGIGFVKANGNTITYDNSTYLTSVPAQSFSSLTGKPTTLSGYGITDAIVKNIPIVASTFSKITYDTNGLVTGGSILSSTDIPDNSANTTGTAGNITANINTTLTTLSSLSLPSTQITGVLTIPKGGTNSTAIPTNGGIAYGNGTSYAFTPSGVSGQILQSNGLSSPSWQTVFPTRSTSVASAAINTTATYITPSTFLIPGNTLNVGDNFKITIYGTNTSTLVGTNVFTPRIGSLGTIADLALTTLTSNSAATGTSVPFIATIYVSIRSVGATGSAYCYGNLLNNGITGITAITGGVINSGGLTTINTTIPLILGCSFASSAITTTSTFQNVIVQKN